MTKEHHGSRHGQAAAGSGAGGDGRLVGQSGVASGRATTARTTLAIAVVLALAACSGEGQTGAGATGAVAGASGTADPEAGLRPPGMKLKFIDSDTGAVVTTPDEEVIGAPVDRGDASSRRAAPVGDPAFRNVGSWSAARTWPEVAIHAALTPDGRVMTFGTDANGAQGAQFNYSVWDPASDEHLVLPNTTPTDIFCSAQILLPGNGDLLLAGGDIRGRQVTNPDTGGIRVNWGVDDVNRYHFQSRTLTRDTPMRSARWYASVLTLPDGRVFTAGGVDGQGRAVGSPEVYDPATGTWTSLPGITTLWESYPRTFLAPSGDIIAVRGTVVNRIDIGGSGSMTPVATLPSATDWRVPAVEYATGKLLVVRQGGGVSLIDLNGATPTVTEGAGVGPRRDWASLTVLPDGQVLLTGGGLDNRGGANLSLGSSIWNPATGAWTEVAPAAKSREYHSVALLLPDGRVLSAGGGAPGPVLQLNGEVYTPPSLYDAAGNLAARPAIASAPATMTPGATPYRFRMGSADPVTRVTMVRAGSVTHAFNFDQSFVALAHVQQGDEIAIGIDHASTVLRPGYYLLYAFNAQGVPSVAHIVRVDPRASEQPAATAIAASIERFIGRDDLTIVGSAHGFGRDGRLQLTTDAGNQVGGVYYRTPVRLDGRTSFTQQVQFRSLRRGPSDGMAIVLQGASASPLGLAGEGLGYGGVPNSVAVEIDTYQNGHDPDANHLAILTNGDLTARALHSPSVGELSAGAWRTAWIDYDAVTRQLSVRLRFVQSDIRPARPVLSFPIDLPAVLGSDRLYVGLTSATGGVSNPWRLRKWTFSAGADARSTAPVIDAVDDASDLQESEATAEIAAVAE